MVEQNGEGSNTLIDGFFSSPLRFGNITENCFNVGLLQRIPCPRNQLQACLRQVRPKPWQFRQLPVEPPALDPDQWCPCFRLLERGFPYSRRRVSVLLAGVEPAAEDSARPVGQVRLSARRAVEQALGRVGGVT